MPTRTRSGTFGPTIPPPSTPGAVSARKCAEPCHSPPVKQLATGAFLSAQGRARGSLPCLAGQQGPDRGEIDVSAAPQSERRRAAVALGRVMASAAMRSAIAGDSPAPASSTQRGEGGSYSRSAVSRLEGRCSSAATDAQLAISGLMRVRHALWLAEVGGRSASRPRRLMILPEPALTRTGLGE